MSMHIVPQFQFHKGTIRTDQHERISRGKSHFNSIKVRLEQSVIILSDFIIQFQFHKGTIRTHEDFYERYPIFISIP